MKIRIEAVGSTAWDKVAALLAGEKGDVTRTIYANGFPIYDANFHQRGEMVFNIPARVCSVVQPDGTITPPDPAMPFPPEQVDPPPPNAIDAAERFIERHFSTARLLQLKVWWDTFPHDTTPKLAATFQWTDGVTRSAVSGSLDFPAPPFTFQELAEEAISIP